MCESYNSFVSFSYERKIKKIRQKTDYEKKSKACQIKQNLIIKNKTRNQQGRRRLQRFKK